MFVFFNFFIVWWGFCKTDDGSVGNIKNSTGSDLTSGSIYVYSSGDMILNYSFC